MTFVTVHILRALPMHNLNRDQNGMPKSLFDGDVQRGRLSSQSIKKPARILFREAVADINAPGSVRTMDSNAVTRVLELAAAHADSAGKVFDSAAAKKTANAVIKGLAKKVKDEDLADSPVGEETSAADKAPEKKDNILLFSDAELETLALALVEQQNGGAEASTADFIRDHTSPSLDVAAFGRMFAARADLSTHAAVAVSHAVMTHEMSLTIDYFTAVDELASGASDAGAGHLGLAYYTSGVYYSTFTVDIAQLRRSWSGFAGATGQQQVAALVQSLVEALPTGKLTNTNAHTKPYLVLAEHQRGRTVYEFEAPVQSQGGGFKEPSSSALAQQFALARDFDPTNYLATRLFAPTANADDFTGAERVTSISDLASWVADQVYASEVSA